MCHRHCQIVYKEPYRTRLPRHIPQHTLPLRVFLCVVGNYGLIKRKGKFEPLKSNSSMVFRKKMLDKTSNAMFSFTTFWIFQKAEYFIFIALSPLGYTPAQA